jgi:hypothetical protein
MALLVFRRYHRRICHARQESINELTETKQVFARAGLFRISRLGRAVEICPIGGDQ